MAAWLVLQELQYPEAKNRWREPNGQCQPDGESAVGVELEAGPQSDDESDDDVEEFNRIKAEKCPCDTAGCSR